MKLGANRRNWNGFMLKRTVGIVVVCACVVAPLAATMPDWAELPRMYVETQYPPPALSRTILTVGNTGTYSCTELQSAIDGASPGDEISIDPTCRISLRAGKSLILRNKGPANAYIIIRTALLSHLAEGEQVGPANAMNMAHIVKQGVEAAFVTEPGAHHYRLVGLEITADPSNRMMYDLVELGDGSRNQSQISQVPHHIVIDRSYIHGTSTLNLQRCVALNSASSAILDSYISDAHYEGRDSQAIDGWNGPGPFKIVNNYLEAAGENVMFGGADPAIANLVPSDVEFRRNLVAKNIAWQGSPWTVKNLLELKNAQRVLIDGNVFQYNWAQAQSGTAIVFTPRDQSGTCPWCVVQDVTFTNNIVRHSAGGFAILGHDNNHISQRAQRITIHNNLLLDIGTPQWGPTDRFLLLLGGTLNTPGPSSVTFDHNTVLGPATMYVGEKYLHSSMPYFSFTNNIVASALTGGGSADGDSTFSTYFTLGFHFSNNVLVNQPSSNYVHYPENFFPATFLRVGFTNPATGDYSLGRTSPYRTKASDGGAVGYLSNDAVGPRSSSASSLGSASPSGPRDF